MTMVSVSISILDTAEQVLGPEAGAAYADSPRFAAYDAIPSWWYPLSQAHTVVYIRMRMAPLVAKQPQYVHSFSNVKMYLRRRPASIASLLTPLASDHEWGIVEGCRWTCIIRFISYIRAARYGKNGVQCSDLSWLTILVFAGS